MIRAWALLMSCPSRKSGAVASDDIDEAGPRRFIHRVGCVLFALVASDAGAHFVAVQCVIGAIFVMLLARGAAPFHLRPRARVVGAITRIEGALAVEAFVAHGLFRLC